MDIRYIRYRFDTDCTFNCLKAKRTFLDKFSTNKAVKNRRKNNGIASLASLKVLFLIVGYPTSLQYLNNLCTSFNTNLFIELKIKIYY